MCLVIMSTSNPNSAIRLMDLFGGPDKDSLESTITSQFTRFEVDPTNLNTSANLYEVLNSATTLTLHGYHHVISILADIVVEPYFMTQCMIRLSGHETCIHDNIMPLLGKESYYGMLAMLWKLSLWNTPTSRTYLGENCGSQHGQDDGKFISPGSGTFHRQCHGYTNGGYQMMRIHSILPGCSFPGHGGHPILLLDHSLSNHCDPRSSKYMSSDH